MVVIYLLIMTFWNQLVTGGHNLVPAFLKFPWKVMSQGFCFQLSMEHNHTDTLQKLTILSLWISQNNYLKQNQKLKYKYYPKEWVISWITQFLGSTECNKYKNRSLLLVALPVPNEQRSWNASRKCWSMRCSCESCSCTLIWRPRCAACGRWPRKTGW